MKKSSADSRTTASARTSKRLLFPHPALYWINWIIVEFDHLFKSSDLMCFTRFLFATLRFACDDDSNIHRLLRKTHAQLKKKNKINGFKSRYAFN